MVAGEHGLALDVAIREHILLVLRITGGCVSEAARLLHVHRRSLQRKMVKLRIKPVDVEVDDHRLP